MTSTGATAHIGGCRERMEYHKMPVNFRRDPVIRELSAKAYVAYLDAVADSAEWETDGRATVAKPSTPVAECISKGAFTSLGSEGEYELYRWQDLMPSKAKLEQRREAWRLRKDKQRTVTGGVTAGHNGEGSRDATERPSTSLYISSELALNGSKPKTVTERRDEPYEALGECWQGSWKGLPDATRGRINTTLKSLRNMTENADRTDEQLASEIRRRWDNAVASQPDWEWTPQTFLTYWRKLERAKPRVKPSTAAALGRAERLEAEGQ